MISQYCNLLARLISHHTNPLHQWAGPDNDDEETANEWEELEEAEFDPLEKLEEAVFDPLEKLEEAVFDPLESPKELLSACLLVPDRSLCRYLLRTKSVSTHHNT